jgi:hypothetical protein
LRSAGVYTASSVTTTHPEELLPIAKSTFSNNFDSIIVLLESPAIETALLCPLAQTWTSGIRLCWPTALEHLTSQKQTDKDTKRILVAHQQPIHPPPTSINNLHQTNHPINNPRVTTKMALPPNLTVSPSPDLTTSPPARGAEMRSFLQARLQKNRAPPLVHSWDFWHDRQDRGANSANSSSTSPDPSAYEDRLVRLAEVNDIRAFWSVFNNFDTTLLPLRDSVHLFKRGVKPIWEDPRNVSGGAWTFRVPKQLAPEFWKEVCMMAVGEQLQAAVAEEGVETFRDDICGVSLGVRFGSMLVQVWNRDGGHEAGVGRVLEVIWRSLSEGLRPREGSFYYKRHNEHAAFAAGKEEGSSGVGGGSAGVESTGVV